MKKGLAIFTIIAFASTFVACKKEYTCTCTTTTGTVSSLKLSKMTKGDAKAKCTGYEFGGTTCSI